MIQLLAVVPKPAGISPGQRFRLEQWAPRLEANHGIRIDFVPFESPRLTAILYQPGRRLEKASLVARDMWRRRHVVAMAARKYDGVIVFREAALIGPAIYERMFRRANVPMFFDFDDAIWVPQIGANGIFSWLHFFGKAKTICKLSRVVLVGNEHLADYARQHNDQVAILPTSIDLDGYPVQPPLQSEEPFVIGWSGSLHTLQHLEHARGALERLARRRKIIVKVICNRPLDRPIAGAETIFVPWQEAGEAKEIGAAHVGIMPLPDDKFARGKCGLKALQYMATGRPVVLSPVGANKAIVCSGQNGMLAGTEDEWVAALELLASSPSLREAMGVAARKTVEERYSRDVVAAKFADVVKKALGTAVN